MPAVVSLSLSWLRNHMAQASSVWLAVTKSPGKISALWSIESVDKYVEKFDAGVWLIDANEVQNLSKGRIGILRKRLNSV